MAELNFEQIQLQARLAVRRVAQVSRTVSTFEKSKKIGRQNKKGPYPYLPCIPNLFLEQFLVAYFSTDFNEHLSNYVSEYVD